LDDGEFDHDPDLKADVEEYLGSDSGGEYTGPDQSGTPVEGGIGYNPISGKAYQGEPANLGAVLDKNNDREVTVEEWYEYQHREDADGNRAAGLRGLWRSHPAKGQKQVFDVLTMGTQDQRLSVEQRQSIQDLIDESWPEGDPSTHEYYAGPEQYGNLVEGGIGYNPISGKAYQGEPANLGATLDDDGDKNVTIDEWIEFQQREGASGTSGVWRGRDPQTQKMIWDVLQMGVDDPRLTRDEKNIIQGLMTDTWPNGDPSTYYYPKNWTLEELEELREELRDHWSSGVISGAQQ
jgi:hypothetical protein